MAKPQRYSSPNYVTRVSPPVKPLTGKALTKAMVQYHRSRIAAGKAKPSTPAENKKWHEKAMRVGTLPKTAAFKLKLQREKAAKAAATTRRARRAHTSTTVTGTVSAGKGVRR